MDLDAKHSFYHQELAKVYANLMYNTYGDVSRKFCEDVFMNLIIKKITIA